MEVIYSANRGQSQQYLLDYLRAIKETNPSYKVLDIGGARNPWTVEVADSFVDLFPVDGADVIIGDLNTPAVWEEIRGRNFDFCVCSHLLEDIRDPVFVLGQIRQIFAGGYIAMPNKHVEFNHIDSGRYVGYAHHRWIFTLAEEELRFVAKFPIVSYFSPRTRLFGKLTSGRFFQALKKLIGKSEKRSVSDIGYLPWWRRDLAGRQNELAFIWRGPIEYLAINGDYAGQSKYEMAEILSRDLRDGL